MVISTNNDSVTQKKFGDPGLEIDTNARDLTDDTILGASICGGCSVNFVRHLIDHELRSTVRGNYL